MKFRDLDTLGALQKSVTLAAKVSLVQVRSRLSSCSNNKTV